MSTQTEIETQLTDELGIASPTGQERPFWTSAESWTKFVVTWKALVRARMQLDERATNREEEITMEDVIGRSGETRRV